MSKAFKENKQQQNTDSNQSDTSQKKLDPLAQLQSMSYNSDPGWGIYDNNGSGKIIIQGNSATAQRVSDEEEELVQGKCNDAIQKQELEEEELIQGKFTETIQRQELEEEEELIQGKFDNAIQKQSLEEEEELIQGKTIQKKESRKGLPDELKSMSSYDNNPGWGIYDNDGSGKIIIQGNSATAQRVSDEEEELMQGKSKDSIQKQELEEEELQMKPRQPIQKQSLEEEEELMQGKFDSVIQKQSPEEEELLQGKAIQKKENKTGLPDDLKTGIENMSGISLDDVKVHRNSNKPANVGAHAYTQGTDIHVAPGQDKHIAHEAWHVVQQNQGRVQPTTEVGGTPVNDNSGLEKEADELGASALNINTDHVSQQKIKQSTGNSNTIQRYVPINPADYELGDGSSFESQRYVHTATSSKFEFTESTQTNLFGMVDTVKEKNAPEDIAENGFWNYTKFSMSDTPTINYSINDDQTKAIAIERTTDEPKVFYATPNVVTESNNQLDAVGAEAYLANAGGSLEAPKDPAVPAGEKISLNMVKPGKKVEDGSDEVLEKFGTVSECNSFIKYIIGTTTQQVAVFSGNSEAIAEREHEPTLEISEFARDSDGTGADLAEHLKTENITSGSHGQSLPADYKNMVNKDARDAALGINKGANADVGEGYVIAQGAEMPGSVDIGDWLSALDKKIGGLALSADEEKMFKQKWGYHYAGIVAKVGDDSISLENYNRGTVESWALDNLYQNKINSTIEFRNYLASLNGETIPSIPKLRNQWFLDLSAKLQALGEEATALQKTTIEAINDVRNSIKGLEIGAARLWHFKMYGSGQGQSFHEQWAPSLDDATTLRIRQSTNDQYKARQLARINSVMGKIDSERISPVTSLKIALVDRNDLPLLTNSDNRRNSTNLVNRINTKLYDIASSAIRGWGLDAATRMGKNVRNIPAEPDEKSKSNIVEYGNTVSGIIQNWEGKGWAITKKSKTRLANKRADLADFRRKVGVALNAINSPY